MIFLTFVGIGLWIRFRRQIDDKAVQRDLGLELMYVWLNTPEYYANLLTVLFDSYILLSILLGN